MTKEQRGLASSYQPKTLCIRWVTNEKWVGYQVVNLKLFIIGGVANKEGAEHQVVNQNLLLWVRYLADCFLNIL